ncbi:hypothetical protein [Maribacter sp. 1_MG-2023]|nr:hypothetical protein [Maribacter sp. 1_MG-2023]
MKFLILCKIHEVTQLVLKKALKCKVNLFAIFGRTCIMAEYEVALEVLF